MLNYTTNFMISKPFCLEHLYNSNSIHENDVFDLFTVRVRRNELHMNVLTVRRKYDMNLLYIYIFF